MTWRAIFLKTAIDALTYLVNFRRGDFQSAAILWSNLAQRSDQIPGEFGAIPNRREGGRICPPPLELLGLKWPYTKSQKVPWYEFPPKILNPQTGLKEKITYLLKNEKINHLFFVQLQIQPTKVSASERSNIWFGKKPWSYVTQLEFWL